LQPVLLEEAVLKRMQFAVLFETFDGRDRAPISLDSEGVHDLTARPSITTVHAPQ
jgi:hypothetical protein